jgi:rhodanese-related sulfurtransferase
VDALTEQEQDLTPERVAELLREGDIQLIDIREDYEHEAGRIEGDRHVVMDRLPAEADALAEADEPIVFYCRTGSRSGVAVQAFRASGRSAYHLDGGIVAWVERGLPIEGEVAPH